MYVLRGVNMKTSRSCMCGTDDVGAALKGEAAPSDWEPDLKIFDTSTQSWKLARETCPPELQFSEVDHATRRYSVDVCHLTQVRTGGDCVYRPWLT